MRTGYILPIVADGPTVGVNLFIQDSVAPENNACYIIDLVVANGASMSAIAATVESTISDYLSTNSVAAVDDYTWLALNMTLPEGLVNAPQAAIADAPDDAVTSYNVVTTLLGALTGAVNTANGKQNDIAAKLNALLAELRTLGLIAT